MAALEQTVNAHEWDKLLSDFVDDGYVEQQHDQFLNGRTHQFVRELLFPGMVVIEEMSKACQRLCKQSSHEQLLSRIEDFSVLDVEDERIRFSFSLADTDCTFDREIGWIERDDEPRFAIIGAVG